MWIWIWIFVKNFKGFIHNFLKGLSSTEHWIDHSFILRSCLFTLLFYVGITPVWKVWVGAESLKIDGFALKVKVSGKNIFQWSLCQFELVFRRFALQTTISLNLSRRKFWVLFWEFLLIYCDNSSFYMYMKATLEKKTIFKKLY